MMIIVLLDSGDWGPCLWDIENLSLFGSVVAVCVGLMCNFICRSRACQRISINTFTKLLLSVVTEVTDDLKIPQHQVLKTVDQQERKSKRAKELNKKGKKEGKEHHMAKETNLLSSLVAT